MSLSSSHLDAFAEVAKTGSFSVAARNLHITQSALSQRIINLEQEIATSLIIRDPSGLRLTPGGEELLRFHQAKSSLEKEAMARIVGAGTTLGGAIRIGAFSSITRSVVMPSLSSIVTKYNEVSIEILTREFRELPRLLMSNQADFVFTATDPQKQDVEVELVGWEENVLVESSKIQTVSDFYFDHDVDDQTTMMFFKHQKKSPRRIRRAYLDEVYAIIDAVEAGWGRAVVPQHLIAHKKSIRMCKGYRPLRSPIYLCHYRQPFYSKLHSLVWQTLTKNVPVNLTPSKE